MNVTDDLLYWLIKYLPERGFMKLDYETIRHLCQMLLEARTNIAIVLSCGRGYDLHSGGREGADVLASS